MNKAQAVAAIQSSLDRGSGTPCTWSLDRDAYIAEKSALLLGYVIEPLLVEVRGESFHYGVKEKFNQTSVYAIASHDENWLLYAPNLNWFSLAFGSSADDLNILGFASDDALAEWLG